MPEPDPRIGRRAFLVTSALIGATSAFRPAAAHAGTPPAPATARDDATVIGAADVPRPSSDTSIRPFHFRASDEALADLRRRIAAIKWPGRETVPDASQGVQLATMQKLARY